MITREVFCRFYYVITIQPISGAYNFSTTNSLMKHDMAYQEKFHFLLLYLICMLISEEIVVAAPSRLLLQKGNGI